MDLKDKKIIVVGSEGGIGKAIVTILKEEGILPIELDIKTGFDITNELDRFNIYSQNDNIDGIVIAHGVTSQLWDKTIEINLESIYKFLIIMKGRLNKGASIVNITSLGGHLGFPDNPQYCASKGGLRVLTKALALDWGKDNIRVNNVVPGYIKTNMTNKSYNDKKLKKQRDDRMILNRWGEPEDVANAVIFLLSDKSSYITGIDLVVDGGWLAKGL